VCRVPPFASEQGALVAGLDEPPLPLPLAVHEVQLRDVRMPGEHVARVRVDERVDLGLGRALVQHAEDGGGEQHVAVMSQLHHQHAPERIDADGIRNHSFRVANDPARRKASDGMAPQRPSKRMLKSTARRGAS
jgi:hypothetical protein